jgi:ABC-type nitrate/sulfonate/bicarbonate transport system substrate-binding protein
MGRETLKQMLAVLWTGIAVSLVPQAAPAADTVLVGSVDPSSANLWPLYIGRKLGYFDAAGLNIDLIFAPSNAAVVQQLAAGSYDIAPSAGMVDPVRAIEKGAPEAIVRIVIQAPPYALLAKRAVKTMRDLKGKTITLGGAKDITRIFAERMLASNGLKPSDYDTLFAGATSARFAALQSGAVDAAILTVPFNFYAETAGFTNLGFTFDYLPDMPFAGMAVNRTWASANPGRVVRFPDVYNKSIAWFRDGSHREEAVRMMVETSKLDPADVGKAYDFLHDKNLFEPTGKVSRAKLGTVVDALRELGDVPADFLVDRLLLPGITQTTD